MLNNSRSEGVAFKHETVTSQLVEFLSPETQPCKPYTLRSFSLLTSGKPWSISIRGFVRLPLTT